MNTYGRDFGGESGALRPRKTLVWQKNAQKNLVVEWSDPVAAKPAQARLGSHETVEPVYPRWIYASLCARQMMAP